MRIAFGLLAILAIGISATIAYGAQKGKPVLSVFRTNVGFLRSSKAESKLRQLCSTRFRPPTF